MKARPVASQRLPNGRLIGLVPGQPIPLTFTHVVPDTRRRYDVQIEVYPTLPAMRAAVRADLAFSQRRGRTFDLLGYCVGNEEYRKTPTGRRRRGRAIAIIRLAKTHLTVATITHECLHAALRYLDHEKIAAIPTDGRHGNVTARQAVRDTDPEERLATIVGNLCKHALRALAREYGVTP